MCDAPRSQPVPATQVIARDRHAQYLYACASVGATIEMIATEVRHLQRTEVREAEEGFKAGQKGSSAMPHKRNPITAERLSGLARILRGNLQAGLEDVAPVARARHLPLVGRAGDPARLLATSPTTCCARRRRSSTDLQVDADRMLENLDRSLRPGLQPARAARAGRGGLTRDEAYRIVQDDAMRAWQRGHRRSAPCSRRTPRVPLSAERARRGLQPRAGAAQHRPRVRGAGPTVG